MACLVDLSPGILQSQLKHRGVQDDAAAIALHSQLRRMPRIFRGMSLRCPLTYHGAPTFDEPNIPRPVLVLYHAWECFFWHYQIAAVGAGCQSIGSHWKLVNPKI